jgi:hypothetical protein
MKKIFIGLLLAGSCFSCKEDFIDLQPISDMNAGIFYKTEQDMNQAVLSPYASLRSLYNQPFIYMGEIRSDNTTFSWVPGNSKTGLHGGRGQSYVRQQTIALMYTHRRSLYGRPDRDVPPVH